MIAIADRARANKLEGISTIPVIVVSDAQEWAECVKSRRRVPRSCLPRGRKEKAARGRGQSTKVKALSK
jgi:hypothetical protein